MYSILTIYYILTYSILMCTYTIYYILMYSILTIYYILTYSILMCTYTIY